MLPHMQTKLTTHRQEYWYTEKQRNREKHRQTQAEKQNLDRQTEQHTYTL